MGEEGKKRITGEAEERGRERVKWKVSVVERGRREKEALQHSPSLLC